MFVSNGPDVIREPRRLGNLGQRRILNVTPKDKSYRNCRRLAELPYMVRPRLCTRTETA